MQKPSWKLEAEARRESLPEYWTLTEVSKLCGYTGNAYLSREAQAGKFISYKVGNYRVVPNLVAETLWLKSQKS